MKTKEEIEKDVLSERCSPETIIQKVQIMTLEVLLDIRELLSNKHEPL